MGIRDVILPGDMEEILNRVTEARKAAEAALVTRREETAAIRSQANTARIFESNPTLMRLRELEVLEKVAEKANLSSSSATAASRARGQASVAFTAPSSPLGWRPFSTCRYNPRP